MSEEVREVDLQVTDHEGNEITWVIIRENGLDSLNLVLATVEDNIRKHFGKMADTLKKEESDDND